MIFFIMDDVDQTNELEEIYRLNAYRFYAIAFSRLQNEHDAKDAVQEAFLRIANNPKNLFKIPAHKKVAYIDVIIRNVSCGMLKTKNKKSEAELDENFPYELKLLEDIVLDEISAEELINFIMSMSPAKKDVMFLKISYGYSNSQIAEALRISETAVRKRISDAYKLIKDFLNSRSSNL